MVKLKFEHKEICCQGVIFDKDCTLTDSFAMWPELISRRVDKLVDCLALPPGADALLFKIMGLDPFSKKMSRSSPVVAGTRLETAAAVAGVLYMNYGYAWDYIIRKVSCLFEESDGEMGLDKQAIPFPGLPEKIQMLHQAGCVLAVATNDSYARTREIINILGLENYFAAIACADQVANAKPDPAMVNLVCQKTGLKPADFILVGDSLLDMQMGVKAGTKLNVGVLTGASRREELLGTADWVLQSVTDLEIVK
ncbi:phosphoglycolate phosphatase [Desulfocucumis palustris]|uniref:Phosphoglycolate phosphatase n=1 Tax=Desulfocucumis palustris TaxID=1898651 RepID=A0A2L2XDQ6_9FIRM|nr:HAD family hydrolase [Desulfocucumis palustris]GBF34272.1 phosphoglycolate phosphatase [Desulfocucumis palustris]